MQQQYQELANRFARVQRHLRKKMRRQGATCWRVYEKDIADQPLIVDWYDGDAVCWALDRTRNETPADEEAWLDQVREALRVGLGIDDAHLWLKRRRRQEDRQHGGQYQPLDRRGATKAIDEHGMRLEVNLSDYLDTGLFLDHRPTRRLVREEAPGKDMLNLFCYTGSFTVAAALGGARTTTSVDLSNTYLAWAGRNLALNGAALGDTHRLVKADALAWLAEQAETAGAGWDVIVLDPPTFSNSTAMAAPFTVERDHPLLLRWCHTLLRPGGVLWFSCNQRGFALAGDLPPFAQVEDVTARTTPEDFHDRVAHRCWRMRRS